MVSFHVNIVLRGKTSKVEGVTPSTNGVELYRKTLDAFELSDETQLKLLYKGKQIERTSAQPIFPIDPKKTPKVMAIATSIAAAKEIASKKSDPTIRGFDQSSGEQPSIKHSNNWGEGIVQNKQYKFCRFKACTWQSFGHRPNEKTPHAFAALQLLEKLATDPGIVAIMKERELVVGTLGEMDPIDDRLMQQKEQQGGCLLGYNTNAGARIDMKLRTDDLQGFRSYADLASTLIHELSHNWVGEHNLLFWTNYAQMRAEYLFTHARLRSTIVQGKTTAALAGLDTSKLDNVFNFIMHELVKEMAQHGLHPTMIQAPIRSRCQELENRTEGSRVGSGGSDSITGTSRERAFSAAERRMREAEGKKK
mmetsp:Transcript_15628/g.23024  ORF Transcript_15628/g.23024 Transcript_15628/m.23024 type:complete len:365 (-) Transcript_15628:136-1230(-)